MTEKIVLYTAIIDNYDGIETLLDKITLNQLKNLGIDVILFTNNRKTESNDLFKVRYVDLKYSDPYRTAREIKLRPDLFLPDYQISVWLDSNLKIINPEKLYSFLTKCLSGFDIAIKLHPTRNCIYIEEDFILKYAKDDIAITKPQVEKYKSEGYPANNGLFETNVIFRRHLSPISILFGKLWLKEVLYYSHRDQLSCNYVSWKNKIRIYPMPHNLINNIVHKNKAHKFNNSKNPTITDIKGYLNNFDITTWIKKRIECVKKKFFYVDDSLVNILKENNIDFDLDTNKKFMLVLSYQIDNVKFIPKYYEYEIKSQVNITLDNRNLNDPKIGENYNVNNNNIKEDDNFILGIYRSINKEVRIDEIYNKNWISLDEAKLIKTLNSISVTDYFYDIDRGFSKELVLCFSTGKVLICKESKNKFIKIDIFRYNPTEIFYHLLNKEIKLGFIFLTFGDKWKNLKNNLENIITLTNKLKNKYILVTDYNSTDNFFTPNLTKFYDNIHYEKIQSKNEVFVISALNIGIKKCLENKCDIILFSDPFNELNHSLVNFINTIYFDNNDEAYVYSPVSNNPGPIISNLYQKCNAKNFKDFNNNNNEDYITLEKDLYPNYFFLGLHSKKFQNFQYNNTYIFNPILQGKNNIIDNFILKNINLQTKIIRNCFVYRDSKVNLKCITNMPNLKDLYHTLSLKNNVSKIEKYNLIEKNNLKEDTKQNTKNLIITKSVNNEDKIPNKETLKKNNLTSITENKFIKTENHNFSLKNNFLETKHFTIKEIQENKYNIQKKLLNNQLPKNVLIEKTKLTS